MPTAQDTTGGFLEKALGPGLWYDNNALGDSDASLPAPVTGIWMRSFTVINEGASKVWWMCFDALSVPGNGASPKLIGVPLYPNQSGSWDLAPPREFVLGIVWAASSTPGTLTLDSSATLSVTIGHS